MSRDTQGIIIILDIGRYVAAVEEKNEKSFFVQAKECTARIIERKIISQGKNLIGIILLGSKITKNNLASEHGGFKHISFLSDMEVPTWKMIRDLPEQPTDAKCDWFDAMLVAADYYKNVISGVKFSNKKIILMTNFKRTPRFDAQCVEEVLNGFKEEDYEVDIIGPDIYSSDYDKNQSILLGRQFVETTNGATETFDNTMRYLLFHKKRVRNMVPWNVDLSIGPNIKIPVSTYIRIKDESIVQRWIKAIKNPITSTASTSEALDKDKKFVNPENQTVVEESEKIQGFSYGQKVIPLTQCDKTMLYVSGDKSLSVYGFTQADNIKWQNLNGEGLHYVFGRKNDKRAQEAVRCLVECMHELNLVGLVRKVHNNNNAPKMLALMPVIDTNNFICLSMVPVCFKDDIKHMMFPSTSLKKYSCSKEQVDAFKQLIHSMDLTKAYDDSFDDAEAFPIAECVSPFAQYVLDCIAYRAMNPGKPLPTPREEIMSLFQVPPLLLKKSKEPIEKLKKLFDLKMVESKAKKNKKLHSDFDDFKVPFDVNPDINGTNAVKMPKIQLPDKSVENKTIGTIDPVADFDALKDDNTAISVIAPKMIKAIESLIYGNIDGNYDKPIDAMVHLRKEYLQGDPIDYNNWIKKLKIKLAEQGKNDVIDLIIKKNASFVLKGENSLSDYEQEDSHEESQHYEVDTIPNSTELTMSSEVQNMFDDEDD